MAEGCKICGYEGGTCLHHIIPEAKEGEDSNKNIIRLCLNHHWEAHRGYKEFNKQHGLEGEKISKKKKNAIVTISFYIDRDFLTEGERHHFLKLQERYVISKYDAIATLLGISVRRVVNKYCESNYEVYKLNKHKLIEKAKKLYGDFR